jgi:hypothetical protein
VPVPLFQGLAAMAAFGLVWLSPNSATRQDRRGGESNQKHEAHKGNRAAICARGTAHRAAPRNALPRRGSPNSRPARLRLPQQKSRAWPDESYGKSGEDVETGGP